MYDQIIGEWLVVIGLGGFLLWLAARVYHATRDAARKTSRANLGRVITGEEYAHIWHQARVCECEDGDCVGCALERGVRGPGFDTQAKRDAALGYLDALTAVSGDPVLLERAERLRSELRHPAGKGLRTEDEL